MSFNNMKTKLTLFFINNPLIITVLLYLIISKGLAITITNCEGEVTLASLQTKKIQTYIEATPRNMELLARERAEQKQQILRMLFRYTEEIKSAFDAKGIPLYANEETQQLSVTLYFTNRDFLDRMIVEHSDSVFRQVIEYLWYHHMEYNNVMLDHLIAIYKGIIANPANVDTNGFLIKNRGIIDNQVYQETLNKLLENKPH